jgi:hypothetical protein
MKTLLYLLLIIFPLGQLTRISTPIEEITVYPQDLLVLFITISLFFSILKNRDNFFNHFNKNQLGYWILGFFLIGLFSLCFNFNSFNQKHLIISSMYLFRWTLYSILYIPVQNLPKEEKKKILYFLIISIFVSVVLGLMQYFFWPDFRFMQALDWDPHFYRLVGPWFDPGFTALIYSIGLFLLLPYLKQKKFSLISLFSLFYIGLALTYARSGYLVYLTGITIYCLKKNYHKLLAVLFICAVCTFIFLPRPPKTEGVKLGRSETILARMKNYQQISKIAIDNPLFGTGFNSLRYTKKTEGLIDNNWKTTHSGAGADNSFLLIFATTGVTGLLIYLNLLGYVITSLKDCSNNFELVVLISIVTIIIHSFINNSLFYPWVMVLGSFLWGLRGIKVYNRH